MTVTDTIVERNGKWLLLSKKTGKVLGTHPTKEEAEAQERAVQASKHSDAAEAPVRFMRCDFAAAGTLAPPEKLPNGFLKVEGRISRIGIQVYRDAQGKEHREFRPSEEVFKPASLASFAMMPVTNTHPDKLLDSTNTRDHQVGTVGENLRVDGDYVAAPMMLTDSEAIRAALCGRQELSCGYSCELIEKAGEWMGEKYDAIQTNILGNHVALVDEARAGAGAAMRLDATDAVMVVSKPLRETTMPQVKIDGLSFEVNDANASAIQQTVDRALETAKESAKKDAAELVKKAQAKLDEATAGKKTVIGKLAYIVATIGARKDAVKAVKHEKMSCPECGGSGETKGEEDAMEKCDYCDGEGHVSALGEFGEKVEKDADMMMGDLAEDPDEDMDAETELEVEQATEEESKKANKDAKDWATKLAKKRSDEAKRHYAAVKKQCRADAEARVKLELAAVKHLGEDEKFDGKTNSEIQALVVKKLKPAAKVDGKDAKTIAGMFELCMLDAEGERLGATEIVRGAIGGARQPALRNSGNRKDAEDARANMLKRNQEACKKAGAK